MTPRDVLEWLRTHATDRRAWMASYASPFYEDVEAANNDRADCIEALIAQTEWRPIATAPKDGTAVWLLVEGHPYLGYCDAADPPIQVSDQWFLKATFSRATEGKRHDEVYGCYAVDAKPTRWMPLPSPPNGDPVGLAPSAHGRTEPDSNAGLAAGSPHLPAEPNPEWIEACARAIADVEWRGAGGVPMDEIWKSHVKEVTAVYAVLAPLIAERCAEIAEGHPAKCDPDNEYEDGRFHGACEVAFAIRAAFPAKEGE